MPKLDAPTRTTLVNCLVLFFFFSFSGFSLCEAILFAGSATASEFFIALSIVMAHVLLWSCYLNSVFESTPFAFGARLSMHVPSKVYSRTLNFFTSIHKVSWLFHAHNTAFHLQSDGLSFFFFFFRFLLWDYLAFFFFSFWDNFFADETQFMLIMSLLHASQLLVLRSQACLFLRYASPTFISHFSVILSFELCCCRSCCLLFVSAHFSLFVKTALTHLPFCLCKYFVV